MRTLVLDLDGTLLDTVPDLVSALNRALLDHGVPAFAQPEAAPMVGDGARVFYQRACAAREIPFAEPEFEAFLADYTAHAADDTRPFPGVTDTLRAMQSTGWQFAVCTNKPAAATHALLDTLQLTPWFASIGCGDSFPVRKPDPKHLLLTLAAASADPAHALMVGDHRNDVQAALGANIPCIFAGWGYGNPDMATGAVAAAAHFTDLPALAERLLPKP